MTWYQLSAQLLRLLALAVREKLPAKSTVSPRTTCVCSYQNSSEFMVNSCANAIPDGGQMQARWLELAK